MGGIVIMIYTNGYLHTEPSILTIKDVQRILHIGKASALKLVNGGRLEAHRIRPNGRWLIYKEDLIEFLSYM